ncbi:MAG: alanine/glycine:cation symporter family protein [Kordiimonas sp.]
MTLIQRLTLGVLVILNLNSAAIAQDSDNSLVQALSSGANSLNNFVFASVDLFGFEVKWIVGFLALPMILLTFYFGFINMRSFKRAFSILKGDYRDDKAPGEVTQFQALSTALSGTVGLGNIASVAAAISVGGPGAIFWMIIIGFAAMSLKFAECTLGVKYRVINEDGSVSGGPMYYLERGLKARGWGKLGKTLAWSYALLAIPSLTQIAQTNQSYEALVTITGIDSLTSQLGFGIFVALLTAVVIVGGLTSIAKVTSKLVPTMAFIYLTAALTIIIMHASAVPAAFATIFTEAFTPQAGVGGMLGVIVIAMQRAVYSTEAGLGSATMAHSPAKTGERVSEGIVALMEPFIDTIVICTIAALVIVISGAYIGG